MRRLLLSVVTVALFAAPVQAAGNIAGTYALDASASDNVDTAIEKAIEPMNFVVRAVAKGKLQNVNKPYTHVKIGVNGNTLSITTDGRRAISVTSGATVDWVRPEDGEKLVVGMKLTGDKLEETFSSDSGKRVNLFEPSSDGKKLIMSVTVTSAKLPKPLTYRLVYKRQK